ncbi:hypothetical protein EDD22DRAFT_232645 [Suillus occidentalis]|nr:hypothetical protein EDD22DRAFT_232645 [Suillus occidentalis]
MSYFLFWNCRCETTQRLQSNSHISFNSTVTPKNCCSCVKLSCNLTHLHSDITVSSHEYFHVPLTTISAELSSGPHGTSNLNYQLFPGFLIDERQGCEKIPDDRFNIDVLDYEGVIVGEVSVNTSRVLGLFDFRISSKGARMMTNSWPRWALELIMKERRLALTC